MNTSIRFSLLRLSCALLLAACGGGSGDDANTAFAVNLSGTWSAVFTPDLCPETPHSGIATFVTDNADPTLMDPQESKIDFNTYGCQQTGFSSQGVVMRVMRFDSNYPIEIDRASFEEMLNRRFVDGVFTVVGFRTNRISYYRDVSSIVSCDQSHNCGVFELQR